MFSPVESLRSAEFGGEARELCRAIREGGDVDGLVAMVSKRELSKGWGDHGWTPAHVAVIAGNVSALKAIGQKGGRLDLEDRHGLKPIEYAITIKHSDCLEALCKAQPKKALGAVGWLASLPSIPAYQAEEKGTQAPDDFGRVLHRMLIYRCSLIEGLLLPNVVGQRCSFFITNSFLGLARRSLFTAMEAQQTYIPRDPLTLDREVMVLTTDHNCSKFQGVVNRVFSYHVLSSQAIIHVHHMLSQLSGNPKQALNLPAKDIEKHPGIPKCPTSDFYLEGGDILQVTNRDGERVLLTSKRGIDLAHSLARVQDRGFFKREEMKRKVAERAKEVALSQTELEEILEKLFRLGHLNQGEKSGVVSVDDLYKINQTLGQSPLYPDESFCDRAVKAGVTRMFDPSSSDSKKETAATYKAQREHLHENLKERFHADIVQELTSPFMHIDCWLMPGPNHTVFYADPKSARDLLKVIHTHAESLGLTDNDRQLIFAYVLKYPMIHKAMQPAIDRLVKQLEAVGLQPVACPGIFYKEGAVINFMNGVAGKSPSGEQLFATLGVNEGDLLGTALMQAFSAWMKKATGTKVTYIGEDPSNPGSFPEGAQWMNKATGLRCLTNLLPPER